MLEVVGVIANLHFSPRRAQSYDRDQVARIGGLNGVLPRLFGAGRALLHAWEEQQHEAAVARQLFGKVPLGGVAGADQADSKAVGGGRRLGAVAGIVAVGRRTPRAVRGVADAGARALLHALHRLGLAGLGARLLLRVGLFAGGAHVRAGLIAALRQTADIDLVGHDHGRSAVPRKRKRVLAAAQRSRLVLPLPHAGLDLIDALPLGRDRAAGTLRGHCDVRPR